MEINYLDFVGWLVMMFCLWTFLPRDFTEELGGALVAVPLTIILTVIWIILFVFVDYNVVDILPSLEITFVK